MDVGRLAWRTPTGAILWEIWGRQKLNFLWQGAALAASWGCIFCKEHGASALHGAALALASVCCFLGAYLHLVICFGYIEADVRQVLFGFPGRLLLKPVSTIWLVLVPMLVGGAAIAGFLSIWADLVLQHLFPVPASSMLWISAVLLSFFWWMQALYWGLPLFRGRSLITVVAAAFHFMIGVIPQMPLSISSTWQWPILAALLLSAAPIACIGLSLMRQGRWEGPIQLTRRWRPARSARRTGARKKFNSALGAQFWLEWHRQGSLLPGISGGIALVALPCAYLVLRWVGADIMPAASPLALLLGPLLLSFFLGPALSKFDPLDSTGELPVYISVRPMSNGDFVMAKLLMALATSALTWLMMAAAACLWLAATEKGALFSGVGPHEIVGLAMGYALLLLLLVIWT